MRTAVKLVTLMGNSIYTLAPSAISGLTGDFNAALGLYKDTGAVAPSVLDGDAVALWQEQSGAARHASNATGAQQPVLKLNQVNGLPTVQFDATNDTLVGSAMSAYIANNAYTVMAVVKYISTLTNVTTAGSVYTNSSLWAIGGGYGGAVFRSPPNAALVNYDGSEDVVSDTIVAGNMLIECRHDAGNIVLKIGSNAEVSGASGNTSSLTGTMSFGTTSAGMGAGVARLLFYNRVLTANERTGLRNYLNSIYGVTV